MPAGDQGQLPGEEDGSELAHVLEAEDQPRDVVLLEGRRVGGDGERGRSEPSRCGAGYVGLPREFWLLNPSAAASTLTGWRPVSIGTT